MVPAPDTAFNRVCAKNFMGQDSEDNRETDLFGSCTLHHAVAHDNPDVSYMKSLIEKDDKCAAATNQFGRIPLHYVVDRCHTSLSAVRILMEVYPEGAGIEDEDGETPYDLAIKWNHGNRVLKEMLRPNPQLDKKMYHRLKFGPLYCLYDFFSCNTRLTTPEELTCPNAEEDENEEERNESADMEQAKSSRNGVEEFRRSLSLEEAEEEEGEKLISGKIP